MGKTSRKKYTPEFKAQVAIEALGQGESLVNISFQTICTNNC